MIAKERTHLGELLSRRHHFALLMWILALSSSAGGCFLSNNNRSQSGVERTAPPDAGDQTPPPSDAEVVAPDVGEDDRGSDDRDSGVDEGDTAAPQIDVGLDSGPPLDCEAPFLVCDGVCVDPAADPEHCGTCHSACTSGETCHDGLCVEICQSQLDQCGDRCVNLQSCTNHCGSCGTKCFPGQHCSDGICMGVGLLSVEHLADALLEKDFLLINVRVPQVGIIPGTDASIPDADVDGLVQFIGDNLHERVVLYCRTIPRAISAAQALQHRGYTSISYLDGGVLAWVEAGHDLAEGE